MKTKWKELGYLWILSFLLGLYSTPIQAQSCPAGWTPVASGTVYPTAATGTVNAGYLNNVVFGGADGSVASVYQTLIQLDFGQSLPTGGQLAVVAAAYSTGASANFTTSFSSDGVNYSTPTLTTIPNYMTTLQTYTVSVPQAFRYVRLTVASGMRTNFDAVSYQGAYCQAPTVSYASCAGGESPAWRLIEPIQMAGTSGLDPDNVIKGPDGVNTNLTTTAQSLVARYAKAFAAGDTVVITGSTYAYSGNFQVLTSMDGITFTSLQTTSFSATSNLQKIRLAATQAFQYIKVVTSGSSQVSLDAVNVFGQVCAATPSSCASGETMVTNGTVYPTTATGTVNAGYLNNVVFGGADGSVASVHQTSIQLDFGQSLPTGGQLTVVAGPNDLFTSANFTVSFSSDGVNYSTPTPVTIHYTRRTLEPYAVLAPQDFRYVRLTVASGMITGFDAVSYQIDYCKKAVVSYASCAGGESQVWRYIVPSAAAGTASDAPANVLGTADGTVATLTTTTDEVVVKFDKAFSVGDTLMVTGSIYAYSGGFQVLTSMDGVNFTLLQTTAFTNSRQPLKIVVAQPSQYVKIISLGSAQISVEALNVFGKACVASSGSCSLTYARIAPQTATGSVFAGTANDVLTVNGTSASLNNGQSVVVNFGQPVLAEGDVFVTASSYNTSQPGNFDVYVSTDNVNFTKIGTSSISAYNTVLQGYQFHVTPAFQYVRITPASGAVVKIDYIGAGGISCPPCNVAGVVSVTQATCATAGGSNADAKLTLTSYAGGAAKVGYSVGSSYTGPAFSAASTLTAAPMDLAATLANPTVAQPYIIRVFKDATCYKDYVVTLQPKLCITGDLSLSLSPAQVSGTKGETVSYTLTLTNAGPDAMPGVMVKVPIPANATLLNASAQQGSYSSGTQKWDVGTMPVGNKTMTVTLKIN